MLTRFVKCDIKDCTVNCTEKKYGDGWPGWGQLKGKQDDQTGEDTLYLCPDHLNKVFSFVEKL